jgi:hypothetical protein
VCATTRRFPRRCYFLADQLNRAALSIAANIAEGNGRFTAAARRNFFGWKSELFDVGRVWVRRTPYASHSVGALEEPSDARSMD